MLVGKKWGEEGVLILDCLKIEKTWVEENNTVLDPGKTIF